MNQEITQLIYSSKAVQAFSDVEVQALLDRARAFNATQGISGVLLYADGQFIQVLEGPAAAVDALLVNIENDPRHDHVRVLMRRRLPHRDFAEWHMAFRQVGAGTLASHPNLSRFFDADFSPQQFLPWASPASYLLQAFLETN